MNYRSYSSAPKVMIRTGYGPIKIELFQDKAPKTVENFLRYVQDEFYDNTLFHRVIDNFLIQGGGFEPGMIKKTTRAPIDSEADNGLRNELGTLSMARQSNDPHSATSQFFINTTDNDILDHSGKSNETWGYCVFGRVVTGLEVVERIEGVPTTTHENHSNVPFQEVVIETIELITS